MTILIPGSLALCVMRCKRDRYDVYGEPAQLMSIRGFIRTLLHPPSPHAASVALLDTIEWGHPGAGCDLPPSMARPTAESLAAADRDEFHLTQLEVPDVD